MESLENHKKTLAVDIDDVLCFREPQYESLGVPEKYKHCKPNRDMIRLVNDCFDKGYYILLYTSRGASSLNGDIEKIEKILRPVTEEKLKEWGLKYSELAFGKRHYDLLIDDKAWNSSEIMSFEDIEFALGMK